MISDIKNEETTSNSEDSNINPLVQATIDALNAIGDNETEQLPELIKRNPLYTGSIFYENTFEEIAVRIPPNCGGNCFAKFKGKPEYSIKYSSVIVTEARLEDKQFSEQQYTFY